MFSEKTLKELKLDNDEQLKKAMEIVKNLEDMGYDIKDKVYRILWAESVAEDAQSEMDDQNRATDDMSDEELDRIAEIVAYRYCFEGKYDCNIDYWSNLGALIDPFFDKE